MKLVFEWNVSKAEENFKKHGITFEEARTIFGDPLLMTYPDPVHSDSESRFLNIGCSAQGRVLVAIHTERNSKIRLISVRKATSHERKAYEEGDF